MLANRYPNGILIGASTLASNTPELLDEVPTIAEDGFDEILRKYLVFSTTHATVRAAIAALFPNGTQLTDGGTGLNLWVRTATGRIVGEGVMELEVRGRGLIGATRYQRSVDAQVVQSTGENIVVNMGTGYPFTYPNPVPKLQGNEAALVCHTSYVTTTEPDYTKVSETTDPTFQALPSGYPALPSGPSAKWTGLTNPLYIAPAGWVLEARPVQAIKNASGVEVCWYVQDVHAYYHQKRPGGA